MCCVSYLRYGGYRACPFFVFEEEGNILSCVHSCGAVLYGILSGEYGTHSPHALNGSTTRYPTIVVALHKCWCAVNPELGKNGPELDHSECSMPCAGTVVGEHCGGFYKMLVYEITAYLGCHLEVADDALQQPEPLSFASSEDEQIIGRPWDFQEKNIATKVMPTFGSSSSSNNIPTGACDV